MKYPEEIYATRDGGTMTTKQRAGGKSGWGRRHAYEVGYEAGKAEQADPLAGYSNLTAAIKAKEPIDWEKLDGLKVQCVNPDIGTLRGTLKRDPSCLIQRASGWWHQGVDDAYVHSLTSAWEGEDGWTLWVEGEVPLRRKTADQLPSGTCFRGRTSIEGGSVELGGVVVQGVDGFKTATFAGLFEDRLAREVEVIEEYGIGTFEKPKGDV